MENIQQILTENLETARIDFDDAQNEVDTAMRNLQLKKVALAEAEQELKDYDEKRNRTNPETGEDHDSF